MGYSNGIIQAPVAIHDVMIAAPATLVSVVAGKNVRVSSCDLGVLCSTRTSDVVTGKYTDPDTGTIYNNVQFSVYRNDINMYAKYKPIRFNSLAPISYQDRYNAHFGLDYPMLLSGEKNFKSMAHAILIGQPGNYGTWRYLMPRGVTSGYTEQFRLTDFVRKPDDATDPGNNLYVGYRANAPLPFTSTISHIERLNKLTGTCYYEVNVSDIPSIEFVAYSEPGADISLWDFIGMESQSTSYPYRMVVEVYQGSDSTWYNTQPKLRTVSNAMQDKYSVMHAQLDLRNFKPNSGSQSTLYVVVGFQRTDDADTQQYTDGNEKQQKGFFAPWPDSVNNSREYPFYYKLLLSNFPTLNVGVTQLGYGSSGTFTLVAGIWQTRYNYYGQQMFITLSVSNQSSNSYTFAGEHTDPLPGTTKLEIGVFDRDNNQTVVATPSNVSRQTVTTVSVPSGTTQQTIYAIANVFPSGTADYDDYHWYSLYIRTAGGPWTDVNSIGVVRNRS